ncbi:MAG: hypothetical protein E7Y34_02165, partial [Mycoplasma sp.]|nr:hypothetical protein [Mycoplasma sp.]
RNRFKISKTPFMFKYKNSHIMLLGLRREDIAQDKIKSLANYHVFVFEEADLFKESTFTTSELSLRGYDVRKVILIFNPPREGIYHWIYKRYFPPDYKDGHDKLTFYKNSLILHTSYMDCMYNPPGIIRTMEMLKDGDPYEYDRVVSGNFTFERRMRVYPKYDIVKDDHIYDDSICYYGVDWGFRDTMAIVEVWYSQSYNTLYIKNEWGKEGLDPDEVTEFLIQIPGITQNRVYADSASPAMIKMLRSWIPIKPVKKLQNSILNGIFRIRSMNIKVHESCKETIKEFGLYEWKPHPDDEKLANTSINPKDMHNHFMDAMRYALDRYIAKSPSLLDSMKGDIVRQWQ